MKRILLTVLVLALALASSAVAQDPTPEPGPNAAKMMPDAKKLGKGWSQLELRGLDASSDLFREGAVAAYGGPKGSRIIVYAYLVTESRAAIRQSWEAATSLYDTYRYRLDFSYTRDDALQNLPAPEGCVEAKRIDGENTDLMAPTAVTLCAADPDKIVLAVVIGGIDGISDYSVSDWVAGMAISGQELPKPTAPAPETE